MTTRRNLFPEHIPPKMYRLWRRSASTTVKGWVASVRAQKHVAFVAVQDGSRVTPVQVVCGPAMAAQLTRGAAVACTGTMQCAQCGPSHVCCA